MNNNPLNHTIMTFKITKSSEIPHSSTPPCNFCREIEVSGVYQDGVTIYKGKIWVKDINTLEGLLAFARNEKCSLIITPEDKEDWIKPTFPTIEIYDTYRE